MMLKLRNIKITVFLKKPTTEKEISTKKIFEKIQIDNYKIAVTIKGSRSLRILSSSSSLGNHREIV